MSSTRARKLRKNTTDAERALWAVLRNRRLAGYKFRRQHPVGSYVVDFACLSRRLIIELDGGQHAVAADRDRRRSRWLESQGFRVIRFWNTEVLENSEGVLDAIQEQLGSGPSPSPGPSPLGGEGQ